MYLHNNYNQHLLHSSALSLPECRAPFCSDNSTTLLTVLIFSVGDEVHNETVAVCVTVAVHFVFSVQGTVVGRYEVTGCISSAVDTISFPTVEEGFRVDEGSRAAEDEGKGSFRQCGLPVFARQAESKDQTDCSFNE